MPSIDVQTLLSAITNGADARIFLVTTPGTAKQLAGYPASEMPANTSMAPTGGQIAGVPVLVTDVLESDEMLGFDARQLAGSAGTIGISASENATIDVTGGDVPAFSLWQKNCVGIRAERFFGYTILRAAAVASLDGVAYEASSPA